MVFFFTIKFFCYFFLTESQDCYINKKFLSKWLFSKVIGVYIIAVGVLIFIKSWLNVYYTIMQCQCLFQSKIIEWINPDRFKMMRNMIYEMIRTYEIPLFWLMRYLILSKIASYFSEPNNSKYLVQSLNFNNIYFIEPNMQWFFTNQSFIWNVINQNIFIVPYHQTKYCQNQNLQF